MPRSPPCGLGQVSLGRRNVGRIVDSVGPARRCVWNLGGLAQWRTVRSRATARRSCGGGSSGVRQREHGSGGGRALRAHALRAHRFARISGRTRRAVPLHRSTARHRRRTHRRPNVSRIGVDPRVEPRVEDRRGKQSGASRADMPDRDVGRSASAAVIRGSRVSVGDVPVGESAGRRRSREEEVRL
jgi:hypothetical protein